MSSNVSMTTGGVPVTGRLRARVQALCEDPSSVVERCYANLLEMDESYSRLNPAVRQDVLESVEHSTRLWFNSLLTGTFPSAAEMEVFADFGRRRVHQGVPLEALLRAFRIGGRDIWSALLEVGQDDEGVRDELLFVVSRYLLEYFDAMSQAIAQAYLNEQYQRARWRDAVRYELCSIVFGFPDDVDGFRKAAEAFGIDPAVPRIAVAMTLPGLTPPKLEAEFDRVMMSVAHHLKAAPGDLVRVLRREKLIVWVPCSLGDSMLAGDRRMRDGVASLASSDIRAVGVGLMNQGPAGWAASADEALKALQSGPRENPDARIYFYSDIVLHEGVRGTDNGLRYLNSLLERLAAEPELLSTLETFFDQLRRRKVTADVLGIHPNTLNHRLERIEALLGAELDDARWIAKLHVAVRLWRRSLFDTDVKLR